MSAKSAAFRRSSGRSDDVISLALAGLIVWTAWDFGGGYLATKWVMALVLSLLLIARLLWHLRVRGCSIAPPAIAGVACLVWCGGYLQTIQLPTEIVQWLSPASASAYNDWVPGQIRAEASGVVANLPGGEFAPISVAPELTRMALAIPASFAVAAWLASLCFSAPSVGMRFLVVIACAGGVLAFFGLGDAVLLTQASTSELWERMVVTPTRTSGAFGPFVNNNNGGGFLILAIGCSLGAIAGLMPGTSFVPSSNSSERCTVSNAHSKLGQRQAIQTVVRYCLFSACLLALVVMIAGVFGSRSRGAFLGLIAGTLCLSIVALRSRGRSRLVVILSVLSFGSCLLLMGIGLLSRFHGRIETLWSGEAMNDPRIAHWKDSIEAASQYFPAGAGLGTYRYAYLPFQKTGGGNWFMHADGMPFECLLEGGLWLMLLILVACCLVFRDLFQAASRLKTLPEDRCRATVAYLFAVSFVLPSMIVSQCFDYGILQPPLLLTVACLFGGLHAFASENPFPVASARSCQGNPPTLASLRGCFIPWVSGILLCLGIGLSVVDLYVGSVVEDLERRRVSQRRKTLDEVPSFQSDIGRLHLLASMRPHDGSLHLLLARLMIDEQRRLGAEFLLEQNDAPPQSVGKFVSPRTLREAHYARLASLGSDETKKALYPINQLMLPGQDLESWIAARGQAAAALALRPLDDTARVVLIELDMLDGDYAVASPELIEQIKQLRRRNNSVLRYLRQLEATQ